MAGGSGGKDVAKGRHGSSDSASEFCGGNVAAKGCVSGMRSCEADSGGSVAARYAAVADSLQGSECSGGNVAAKGSVCSGGSVVATNCCGGIDVARGVLRGPDSS